jgi:viroplasmin and RNaseH domain-containing protein
MSYESCVDVVLCADFVEMKWYVVFKGHCPGVYDNWEECHEQVSGFKGNRYKGYKSREEAEAAFHKFMVHEQSGLMIKEAIAEVVKRKEEAKEDASKRANTFTTKDFIIASLVVVVVIQIFIICKY